MSRLGDLLRTERLRRKMTLKDVARAGGVSESYLKDVEEGKRIIADDQARRILKRSDYRNTTNRIFRWTTSRRLWICRRCSRKPR